MPSVILLKGLPASGKSTWAKKEVLDSKGKTKRVNKDELRAMLDESFHGKKTEDFILQVRDEIIIAALRRGYDIIVDDTNFNPIHEKRIRELAKGHTIEVKTFDTDLEECIRRDKSREKSVGEEVIRAMHEQYLKPPEPIEQYQPDFKLPSAYIFDIDGTLAHMKDRGPYDWAKVGQDTPNFNVIRILKELRSKGHNIIVLSGRDGSCLNETTTWLYKNGINYDWIDLRLPGNMEKDSIIKKRMFDKVKNNYCILGVFDDRQQVVDMWRSLGLTCFQVAPGNF